MTGTRLTGKQSTSINVCYLIDVAPTSFIGGGQTHLLNLVRALEHSSPDFSYHIFGGPSARFLLRFGWSIAVVPQIILQHYFIGKFDLIHAHSVPAMIAGKILSILTGIPIVATIHGTTFTASISVSNQIIRIRSFFEKKLLTSVRYDAEITVSTNFLRCLNINKDVVYIPNGVDLSAFSFHKGSISHPRAQSVLFIGRKNDPVKGYAVLEEAMRLVKRHIPSAHLVVADGSIPSNQIPTLYHSSNLFVLPSLSEGFPLTILEAWAAKLPIIATAVGEVPSLIKEGVNGYLVEPGNAKKLADKIVLALRNRRLAHLGRNGYNLARTFSWDAAAIKTFVVYRRVLAGRNIN